MGHFLLDWFWLQVVIRGFVPPQETLEQSLEISTRQTGDGQDTDIDEQEVFDGKSGEEEPDEDLSIEESEEALQSPPPDGASMCKIKSLS